jgi:hypothetical protein
MELKSKNEELFVRYLLGDVSEQEREPIEERFFADDQYYQDLLVVEDELIYDYLRGALDARQRARFEAQTAASPRRRQKVEIIRGLMQATIAPQEAKERERISFLDRLRSLLIVPLPALQIAMAALLALLAVGSFLLLRRSGELEAELARVEQQREQERQAALQRERLIEDQRARARELSEQLERERGEKERFREEARRRAAQEQAAQSLALSAGTRDSAAAERIAIRRVTARVVIRLDLEGVENYPSYRIEVRTSQGALIWNQDAASRRDGLRLTLPASLLAEGEYEVTLKGRRGDGRFDVVNYYYFIVTEK